MGDTAVLTVDAGLCAELGCQCVSSALEEEPGSRDATEPSCAHMQDHDAITCAAAFSPCPCADVFCSKSGTPVEVVFSCLLASIQCKDTRAEAAMRRACHVHLRVRGLGCRRWAEAGCGICRAGSRVGSDSGDCAGLLCVGSTAPCKTRSPAACCWGILQAVLRQQALAAAARIVHATRTPHIM